ncbi:hypothetical protein PVA45_05490 [Entomospira entomophila]|uniref:Thymidine kinase n=1 Tax=Entomospira entomophila TaxID=2719988 RepID=A0A968KT13_9SPIO|nr:hypothetical protein [Entomospira entomophilus]NIZ40952.1 hypothetical protein [Entomospira entomophilus]WDI35165.1 hypothetical protein PVA45_05490 [Entomospira entomophilus]
MHYVALHLGSMFSGKTSHLNHLASQTLAVGHSVELWLPPLSEEGQKNHEKSKEVSLLPKGVTVRYLQSSDITVKKLAELHTQLYQVDLVLIDETHFFDGDTLVQLFTQPLPANHPYASTIFHCFGLNGTYQLTPWPTISQLIPLASKIHFYRANCSRCGHSVKAGFSHLKRQTSDQIKIEGGSDLYEALCHNCMGKSLFP